MPREKCEAFADDTKFSAKELLAILCRSCKFERMVATIKQYNARSKSV